MWRRSGAAIAITLVMSGCGSLAPPTMPPIATSVTAAFEGRSMIFSVTPWPLDDAVAYLCLRKPVRFDVNDPRLRAADGCAALEADTNLSGNQLRATFSADELDGELAERFGQSRPPWFLAVYGARRPFALATVLTVIDSPIPSDAGPS